MLFRSLAPENSRQAFEVAIDVGADWIETDLRMTADGHIVLFHDDRVGAEQVSRLTLAQLRSRREAPVERWDDILPELAGRIGLDIEIKHPGFEAAVVASLKAEAPEGSFLVSSFDERVLRKVRRLDRSVPTGLILTAHGRGGRLLRGGRSACSLLRHAAADVLIAHAAAIGGRWASAVRRAGIPWHVWTINAPAQARQMADAGAWGIVTDRPDLILDAFPS